MSGSKSLAERLAPLKERAESFLREFEWTWTKAVVFSMGILFFILITIPLARFTDWLIARDRRRQLAGRGT